MDTEIIKDQEPTPIKPVDNRQPNGQFGPGNNANPEGRPKGKTLKEYQAQKYREMTDEQKEVELQKMTDELKWRMSEGNPHQSTDFIAELRPTPLLDALRNNRGNLQNIQTKQED